MTTTTAPREHGILMHARSIEGIQPGRKRQTRRVVKPQPRGTPRYAPLYLGPDVENDPTPYLVWQDDAQSYCKLPCPYGQPGDLLWVRETWSVHRAFDADAPRDLSGTETVRYAADGSKWEGARTRQSIHMPKWAARIWLRVTELRVERVQEITTEDIWAEGVQIPHTEDGHPLLRFVKPGASQAAAAFLPKGRLLPGNDPLTVDEWARIYFAELWDDTNGAGAWERNDWVWVIGFERTEAPRP